MKRKTLVIGLDGATWDLIGPFVDSGKLPLFRKWREEGCSGTLESTVPALTPPGWTSAFTGVNPGKHNIFDFFALDRVSMKLGLATSRDRKYPAFWEIASREGVRVGLFNVPCSYPADEVNGFMVTGMATPEGSQGFAFPEEAEKKIMKDFPGYRFGARAGLLESGRRAEFLKDIYQVTGTQEKAAASLLDEAEVDLFLFVYDEVDRVMHFYWHDSDPSHPFRRDGDEFRGAILDYYRRIEEGISRFLSRFGGDADLLIFSDHGFGPLEKDIYVNRLLHEWGYLEVKPAALEAIRKPLWKRALKKVVPHGARKMFREKIKASPLADPLGYIDMDRTKAFYASVSGRSLFVNGGNDREKVTAELKARLESYVDEESGLRPFRKVFARDEIYSGPCVENAPDMVIMEDGRFAFKVEWSENISSPATQHGCLKSGSHRPEGIFLCHGPSFAQGVNVSGAKICDIAPTLLSLLGIPAGSEMDGRTLSEIFRERPDTGAREYAGLRAAGGASGGSDDEAKVKEKLKSLGYM